MATVRPQMAEDTTPPRCSTRAPATRASGKRNVYGKRRKDAPRAVFEQRSPAKLLEKPEPEAVQDVVDSLQARLADVRIDETTVEDNQHENEAGGLEITTNDKVTEDDLPEASASASTLIEKSPLPEPPSLKATPILKNRYQKMIEVRVTPRAIPSEPQEQASMLSKANPASVRSCKQGTKKAISPQEASFGYVQDDKANSYVDSILRETLSPAAAQGVQKFDTWAARANDMLEVVKLAEGSYGEVYKLRLREDVCQKEMSKSRLARLRACGDGVFKVVPLRAQSGPGSKKFTSIEEIVAEVKMLKYLDPIPGFARFREIHVVQGRFPVAFQKAWDHYKKTKDDCLNPNPSSKRAYPDSQIWAIIEMDDAGCELEKFSWSSIFQVYDIFWGVAMSLARAEEYALFEVTSTCFLFSDEPY